MRKLAILLVLAALAGCGGDGGLPSLSSDTNPAQSPVARDPSPRPEHPFPLAKCPAGAANCAASMGRVIYIESVDPDGDGDLHVVAVVTKGDIVTGAGLTVFDVEKDVRPKKDPPLGATVTGAGPVYTGSHGQKQIQVTKFRVQH